MGMNLERITTLLKASGGSRLLKPRWREQAQGLLALHRAAYPGSNSRQAALGFVPGRIEVFGRHTDYAGGRSLVCAIDKGFFFLATSNTDGMVRMQEKVTEFEPIAFPLAADLAPRKGHWANYPMTMARRMARNFADGGALKGVDISFSSTLPVGSGMSGSSALMMMTFTALASMNGLDAMPAFRQNLQDPLDLAVYLACAENGQGFRGLKGDSGVGTFGGSEDHAAILTARPGILSLFGFSPASLQEEIAWPRGWSMVVAFSGVRAEKTREALEKDNLVSRRARSAVAKYNRFSGTHLETLRELADHGAERKGNAWLADLDRTGEGDPGPWRSGEAVPAGGPSLHPLRRGSPARQGPRGIRQAALGIAQGFPAVSLEHRAGDRCAAALGCPPGGRGSLWVRGRLRREHRGGRAFPAGKGVPGRLA